MNISQVGKSFVVIISSFAVISCGGGEPSEGEIVAAMQEVIEQQIASVGLLEEGDVTLNSLKKIGCNEAESNNIYKCEIEISMTVPGFMGGNQSGTKSVRFVRAEDGWSVLQ